MSFSQKLLLFLIRSTEVERVRDRECSRISLSLAFWTRFSAVFGHYHYFFKQCSLILRCRTSLKRLPTAFSRPVTRLSTSVFKFTTSLAWFVSFWPCWEKYKNVLLDNINIPNSVYFNIALRHNKVCFYLMSKTTYTRHFFMCLMWSLKNYSQITSIATEIIKQPFKCQLY